MRMGGIVLLSRRWALFPVVDEVYKYVEDSLFLSFSREINQILLFLKRNRLA